MYWPSLPTVLFRSDRPPTSVYSVCVAFGDTSIPSWALVARLSRRVASPFVTHETPEVRSARIKGTYRIGSRPVTRERSQLDSLATRRERGRDVEHAASGLIELWVHRRASSTPSQAVAEVVDEVRVELTIRESVQLVLERLKQPPVAEVDEAALLRVIAIRDNV